MYTISSNMLNAISGGATAEHIDDCFTALEALPINKHPALQGIMLVNAMKACEGLSYDEFSIAHERAYTTITNYLNGIEPCPYNIQ